MPPFKAANNEEKKIQLDMLATLVLICGCCMIYEDMKRQAVTCNTILKSWFLEILLGAVHFIYLFFSTFLKISV